MICHEARDLFSARVDELLPPEQRVALDAHLQGCRECSREWERFSRTVGLLRSVGEARAPAGFARRVIERTRREPWPRRLLRGAFLPLHVKLPVEAAAVVLVSVLALLVYRGTPDLQRDAYAPPTAVTPAPPAGSEERPASGPAPGAKPAEVLQAQRGAEVPPALGVAAPAPEPAAPSATRERGVKEEARPAEAPQVGGRLDVAREARKSAAPGDAAQVAARAQGPYHLIGSLKPRTPGALESQLDDLLKQVGGVRVRGGERVAAGSVVEMLIPRDAYPRLEDGLRRLGDFAVETRAASFPEQVSVAVRIAN